ncbi:fimbria/pilus outer membrane usher protein [Pseudomonas protegens]|uniref:fimbria/pilus outer membrane usher protein n=1 Tax=Pseudomonas protegens TaxID=380021 RepID=UPI00223BACDA|nr:fimbria/pilus outer membrane usher protein [Pseudomonas protegens]
MKNFSLDESPQLCFRFALNLLSMLIVRPLAFLPCGLAMSVAYAQEVHFNDVFLPEGSQDLDLSAYRSGNPVWPGNYRADVSINGRLVNRQDVRINAQKDGSQAVVCLTRTQLEMMGVAIEKLSPETIQLFDVGQACPDLSSLIEGANATFYPDSQLLEVSVPQAAMRKNSRGYVSPELWDHGITAATLSYNLNANHSRAMGTNSSSMYLGLNSGLNIHGWRLRHDGSLNWQQRQGGDYHSINTYAQHDVAGIKSQLLIGESYTSGDVFDTFSFRGVQLSSDDRMLPDSLRGYAPIVRGIARTNARVSVRQSGALLLETTVSPGAFVIDDLYSTSYGGELEVTVTEADGSEQRFIVPYASVSQLLRPGTLRFSATAGQTRNSYIHEQLKVLQGALQYGLNNTFTGYGGSQFSDDYMAIMTGLAFGTPIGAMGVDITHAQTDLPSGASRGRSLRLSYSKNILSTGSNFTVAAYRFSTSGYLDLSNAAQFIDAERRGMETFGIGRPRSRLSLTADQSLGDWGQMTFSGYTQNYWNQSGRDVQYQLGYYKQVRDIGYGVSASRGQSGLDEMETTYLFTVSMPLEFGPRRQQPQLYARLGRDAQGNYEQQASISGVTGEDGEYSYGATVGHDSATSALNSSVNGQYISEAATVGAGISQGDEYSAASLTVSGTAVAHSEGLTLSPYRGETMAVISAPDAQGAKVVGYTGMKLDRQGYAVVPYLRPYQLNEVSIDPEGTSMDVDFTETSQQIVPRAGAVVFLKYGTTVGKAVLLNVKLADGRPLPFGASVTDPSGRAVGIAGQGGQVYVRMSTDVPQLLINWGESVNHRCSLALPPLQDKGKQLFQADVECR